MSHYARRQEQSLEEVRARNEAWWSAQPMTYDWHGTVRASPLSEEWFNEIDERWIRASYPYVSRRLPFDRIMPTDLTDTRVLEIGCGMGLQTEHLARRGAQVTAVDLTLPAVAATTARLKLRGLDGTVERADAESLPFNDESFDLVWSWGVIHHSPNTARIVREVARVLCMDGEARLMVYNRDALIARLLLLRRYILGREYRTKSRDEVLWTHTDGYMARYYTADNFNDLLRGFFHDSSTVVLGQEVDVVPLPSRVRSLIVPFVSYRRKESSASRRGAFLFSVARGPLS